MNREKPNKGVLGKTEINPFSAFCLKAFQVLFFAAFIWLFINMLFSNDSVFKIVGWKQIIAALLILTALTCGYILFHFLVQKNQWLSRLLTKRFLFVFGAGMLLLFLLQMIYVYHIKSIIAWDVGIVIDTATTDNWANMGEYYSNYYSHYYNNTFLPFALHAVWDVFKFFGLQDAWLWFSVLNTVAVDIAIIFMVLICKKLFSIKTTYIAFVLSICLFGFTPFLIVPYSDTFSMPFVALGFYLYLQVFHAKKVWQRLVLAFINGIVFCVGYLIKPTVIILLIAIVLIHFLFSIGKNKKGALKNAAAALIVCVCGFLIINSCYATFLKNQEYIPFDENVKVPLTHFYMMGLKNQYPTEPDGPIQYGVWDGASVNLTFSQPDTEAMKKANIEEIKKTLKGYGFWGYLKQLHNKACFILEDGLFFWSHEGQNQCEYMKPSIFKEFIDENNGKYFGLYKYMAQGIWVVIILGLVLPCLLRKRDWQQKNIAILRCAVIGILLFLMLFEARSRYLILYFPCFIMLAAYGYKGWFDFCERHLLKLKNKK